MGESLMEQYRVEEDGLWIKEIKGPLLKLRAYKIEGIKSKQQKNKVLPEATTSCC
jgi:hypothetical protein